jgi:hypothetical protein
LVIEADTDAAKMAYEEGVARARVWSTLEPDGTGTMISTGMEAHDLAAANRNINGLARQRENNGDSRSIDEIRSGVFAQLLTGRIIPNGKKAEVNITGDLTTLGGHDDDTDHLGGFRPFTPTSCDRSWTDSTTPPGPLRAGSRKPVKVFVGTTSRRPTAEQHQSTEGTLQDVCSSRMPVRHAISTTPRVDSSEV